MHSFLHDRWANPRLFAAATRKMYSCIHRFFARFGSERASVQLFRWQFRARGGKVKGRPFFLATPARETLLAEDSTRRSRHFRLFSSAAKMTGDITRRRCCPLFLHTWDLLTTKTSWKPLKVYAQERFLELHSKFRKSTLLWRNLMVYVKSDEDLCWSFLLSVDDSSRVTEIGLFLPQNYICKYIHRMPNNKWE